MKVTLRDISREAGVSVTTVSNVLRGIGRVSDETRAAVLAVAERLGYFKQRRNQTSKMLGVLFCTPPISDPPAEVTSALPEIASYYTAEAVEGIESVISSFGYQLLFQILRHPWTGGRLPTMVEERTVSGVLLVGGTIPEEFVSALLARGLPLVLLFTDHPSPVVNCVLADNQWGAYAATSHLLRLGHRRIGFINGWDATRTSTYKLRGYRQALEEAELPLDPELIRTGDFTMRGGFDQMRALLALDSPPTAVFVADDTMAQGALQAARSQGMAVPGDVAVIGFGDSPMAAYTVPPLTTVRVPKRAIGEVAARRLLDLIHGEGCPDPLKIVVSTQLVVRASCGGAAWEQAGQSDVTPSVGWSGVS